MENLICVRPAGRRAGDELEVDPMLVRRDDLVRGEATARTRGEPKLIELVGVS